MDLKVFSDVMQETEHVLPGEVSHYYYCHTEEIYS